MSVDKKRQLIDGEWIFSNRFYPLENPYNGEIIAEICRADESDVQKAISSAYRAQEVMREMPAFKRSEILYKVSEILEFRKEEFAKLIVLESGKPIKAARGEMLRTVETYRLAAEEAKRLYGETIPMDASAGGTGRIGLTWKEPLGVVVAITPFNFPFNLVAHKLGPAFAAGNTVVLKPAEQTPLGSIAIAEVFMEAGLPKGALQVVTGYGEELSDALIADERVRKVTFTGSAAVGKLIKSKVGLRKCTLELGSNAAVIIEPDIDIAKIVPRCVETAYAFSGQLCISLQRIYVQQSIYRSFVEAFVEQSKLLKLGDPNEETTDISVLIHEKEAARVKGWIDDALEAGAELACGGEGEGAMLEPTVLLNVNNEMAVSCMETFAPIVSIVPYENLQAAIDMANHSNFGLNLGIYTSNIFNAFDAARQLKAGGVIINDAPTFRVDHMPYGGIKDSGYGREGVHYAVHEMTETKFVSINTKL
ncbi:aldehyde dehydrogenase family protein [Cytobacillus horneckiae]|uniref:aldehyde dehydrogenase family protein n=1 Tax=Cytobacillus horneckiae TaxID=549687 RepID=UPI003D9A6445